ncbi:unnamed protein product [Leuciscus chuanchicus]
MMVLQLHSGVDGGRSHGGTLMRAAMGMTGRKDGVDGTTTLISSGNALFEPCEAVAKSLQGNKTSALGATECVNLQMERLKALRVDSTVAGMINQVKDCATKNGMKMPESKFGQDGMKVAAFGEQTVLNAAHGKSSLTLDMQALHLPTDVDVEWLKLQLQMLGDDSEVLCQKSLNPLNPDYVPSLFAYLTPEQRKRNSYSKFEQMQAVKRKRRTCDVRLVAPCDNSSHMQIDDCGYTSAQEGNVRGQTADHSYCNSAVYAESSVPCSNEACHETVRRLTEECTALRSEVYQLREKRSSRGDLD